jgi:hypothetical protein
MKTQSFQHPSPVWRDKANYIVKERVTINEDGQKISEWTVSMDEISDFVKQIYKKS